ncbi:MAG: class I SAM-dependent methyltransferase [Acidobacteriota bacterium]|nr:class I SAM-dependent methyltransferase [Acidobacteriota bacterium]
MSAIGRVKAMLKSTFPQAVAAYRGVHEAWRRPSLKRVFSDIYRTNAWKNPESVSGRGSTLARTQAIISHLPPLLQELGARTLLDAACGDFNWMRYAELDGVKYVGADIVPDLVARNRHLYGRKGRSFLALDITKDRLPRADAVLCRDCLIHLSFESIDAAVANFKRSGAGYLLCTTHASVTRNVPCRDGEWRNINLHLPPFNFPPPLKMIVEDAELGKCLGVWRLKDL